MKEIRLEYFIRKPQKDTVAERKNYFLHRAFFHNQRKAWFYEQIENNACKTYEDVQLYKKYASDENDLWYEIIEMGNDLFKGNFYESYEKFEAEKIVDIIKEGRWDISHLLSYIKRSNF